MQRRCQRAQAAGAARNHEQPPVVAKQGSKAAQNLSCAEIVGLDIAIDHASRIVLGLHPCVVIGKDDVDAAVAFGQECCELLDRAGRRNVQEFTAHFSPGIRQAMHGFRDPGGVPPGQIDDIGGVKALRQSLREREAKVARCAGYQSYFVHVLIVINILIRVKWFSAA